MPSENYNPRVDDEFIVQALQQAGIEYPADQQQTAENLQPQTQATQGQDDTFQGEDVSEYFSEPPIDAAPSVDTAPAPTTSPDVHTAALMAQNLQILQNQFSEQTKQRDTRIQELEARLASYENKPDETDKTSWFDRFSAEELNLTEEQAAQYKGSLPIIERVARAQALAMLREYTDGVINPIREQFTQTVQPLQETVNTTAARMAAAQEQSAMQTLHAKLPWLSSAISTPEYKQFYEAVIPGTGGLTRGLLVQQASNAGNIDAIVDLLKDFKPTTQQNTAQYVAPGRAHTANPTTATAAPPRKGMRLSTYTKALEDYSNGKISPAKLAEYETQWNAALANGTAVIDE